MASGFFSRYAARLIAVLLSWRTLSAKGRSVICEARRASSAADFRHEARNVSRSSTEPGSGQVIVGNHAVPGSGLIATRLPGSNKTIGKHPQNRGRDILVGCGGI